MAKKSFYTPSAPKPVNVQPQIQPIHAGTPLPQGMPVNFPHGTVLPTGTPSQSPTGTQQPVGQNPSGIPTNPFNTLVVGMINNPGTQGQNQAGQNQVVPPQNQAGQNQAVPPQNQAIACNCNHEKCEKTCSGKPQTSSAFVEVVKQLSLETFSRVFGQMKSFSETNDKNSSFGKFVVKHQEDEEEVAENIMDFFVQEFNNDGVYNDSLKDLIDSIIDNTYKILQEKEELKSKAKSSIEELKSKIESIEADNIKLKKDLAEALSEPKNASHARQMKHCLALYAGAEHARVLAMRNK